MVSSPRSGNGSNRLLAAAASRRQFLGWSGAGLAALGLAGCSAGAGSAFDSAKQLTFTSWGTGAEKAAVTKVVDAYAKKVGLTGNSQSIPNDTYPTKLNTLIAGGNVPDAGYLSEGMSMRLGAQGLLYNIADDDRFQQFIPTALHYYAPGKAVSQTCIEAMGMFYDEKALEKAGVDAPVGASSAWKWDDLISNADRLTVDGSGRHPSESGFQATDVKTYGIAAPTTLIALVPLLKSAGVDMFNEAGTKSSFDSSATIKVMQEISDLIFDHRVAPTAAQLTAIGASTGLQLASGRVAMAIDGQWSMLDLNAAKADGLRYNAAVLPTFGSDAYTITLSGANAVFAKSNNRKDAVDLLLALAAPDQVDLYANSLWMPLQQKYYTDETLRDSWSKNDAHPSNYATAIADMTVNHSFAYPSYKIKDFDGIATAATSTITSMFTKKTDMTAACKQLAAQVNGLLKGVYQDTAS